MAELVDGTDDAQPQHESPPAIGRTVPEPDSDWDLLAEQCAGLAESLANETSVYGVLHRVAEASVTIVPGAELVSVTLRGPDDQLNTPVETHPQATQLDRLQNLHNEGPCLDACRTPGPGLATSRDLAAGREWPRWGPTAAQEGVSSVLSIGLFPDGPAARYGALNIYSTKRHGLRDEDRTIAMLLASQASLALAATHAVSAAELHTAQLQQALESRDIIGQAKGILMNRQGISATEAFDILRRTSQDLNIKLTQIAKTIVDRHSDI